MDIFDIILSSNVIPDMRANYSTMIAAIVSITLVLMALDKIREFLIGWHDSNQGAKIDKEFGGSIGGELVRYNRLARKHRGTVQGDLYASRYRQGVKDYDKEDELEIMTNHNPSHEELGYEEEPAMLSHDEPEDDEEFSYDPRDYNEDGELSWSEDPKHDRD